ncbi:chitinase-like protein PB1E7.04c [Camellia sinensis]|uniref:chitinase-like protein PB1E7.04c n=1 Tax=Camellia sinensis TaxID=4442 RepID=UPI001036B076|nr:chitinase-like protein PB1E7.04c [Camellia sinensis]
MEVHLAIPPQDLLMVLDASQAKPKRTGAVICSTTHVTPALAPATTKSVPAASPPPRVTRAASKKITTILFSPSIRTPSISSEVERPRNMESIQAILSLFGSTFFIPFLSLAAPSFPKEIPIITSSLVIADSRKEDTSSSPVPCPLSLSSSSPCSLDLLVAKTIETVRDTSSSSPIPMQPSLPHIRALSAPTMSTEEVDIFEARLASLFYMPPTTPTASNETESLVLASSLLKIFESSSSTSRTSLPSLDLDSCLELLTFFSRIPFEALQRPIIKNGFL